MVFTKPAAVQSVCSGSTCTLEVYLVVVMSHFLRVLSHAARDTFFGGKAIPLPHRNAAHGSYEKNGIHTNKRITDSRERERGYDAELGGEAICKTN